MSPRLLVFFLLLLTPGFALAQTTREWLVKDVETLAADRMQGREAGTEGEALAAEYIVERFKAIGLSPKGQHDQFFYPFDFKEDGRLVGRNVLTINGQQLKLEKDFYPIAVSGIGVANGEMVKAGFGIAAPDLNYDDYEGLAVKGKIVVIEQSSPDGIHPHSKYGAYSSLKQKVSLAAEKGALGIIVVNSDQGLEDPVQRLSKRVKRGPIPVVFLTKDAAAVAFGGGGIVKGKASFEVNISAPVKTGKNVIGWIDRGAKHTIVIGAHYDHLGLGDEGSLHRGEPAIHNGADDNASGIAVLLALANYCQQQKTLNYNYLFMAFSAEEKGLLGSNSFCKNPTIDLSQVNYMINMDMVGRLDPDENKLGINGVGTSPTWNNVLPEISSGDMSIKTTESGVGPSDHTSFYLQDIPVLHFFSGTHSDYHKPSDDIEHINFEGMEQIYGYIVQLLDLLEGTERLEFTATKNDDNKNAPRFTVTLGVIPDYLFDGEGMRIDGVTEGKPAHKAGILKGDIVIQMGDLKVTDMMSYMKGLSQHKKGDKTKVMVRRGEEKLEMDILF